MTTQSHPIVHTPGTGITMQVIRETDQWQHLRPEWDELFAASPTASPPLRFEWLWHWWRVYGEAYGDRGRGLRIITIRKGPRLVGAIPLYEAVKKRLSLRIRRLGFLSTGEAESEETCAEYLDLLHLPGERQTCLDALAGTLFDGPSVAWDELDLPDISDGSPLLDLQNGGRRCRFTLSNRGTCPIADISGGLDAYLARLSANTRQQVRRRLRIAQKAGATLERAMDGNDTERFFEELVQLHQQRWTSIGKPGAFASPRFTEFHRSLARSWVPAGKAVLVRLVLEGRPLAVIYGFLVGTKFDFYQSGVAIEESAGIQSPGTVGFLMLMAHLAERGIAKFDFLRGASSYKQRLATEHGSLVRLHVLRPGIRTRLFAASGLVRRVAAKGGRLLVAAVRSSGSACLTHS